MIVKNETVGYEILDDKCKRKILAHEGNMMMVEVSFEKGGVGALHKHTHEQMCYIAKGSFEYEIDGKKTVVKQGDSIYLPPDVPHGTVALEDAVIIDIFTPQRADFLS